MDSLLLILLIIGIISVTISWMKADLRCPPPKIIYKYIPQHTLDVQFGNDNNPSEIYKDMFIKSSPWIGGFGLGDKTLKSDATNKN